MFLVKHSLIIEGSILLLTSSFSRHDKNASIHLETILGVLELLEISAMESKFAVIFSVIA